MAKKRVGIRNGALFNQTSTLWNNLLAYYTGDGTPDDALGNYNGTLVNGATYGTGKISQGFSFDGVNDVVDFGNNLDFDGSTPFTVSCWMNPNNVTSTQVPLAKASNTVDYEGYWFLIINGKMNFVLSSGLNANDWVRVENSIALSTSTWYHCIMTYDGSKSASGLKVYVNNSLNTQNIIKDTLTGSISNSRNFKLGARDNGFFYNGIIDEVGVWDRELSESEVTELYNSGNGKQYTPPAVSTPSIITDGLVLNLDAGNTLSYPGSGTDWFDLTSNNNDGVLVNGASYVTDGGGSISFDGVNDYYLGDFSSIINETTTGVSPIFTISNWVYLTPNSGIVDGLANISPDAQSWAHYYWYSNPSGPTLNFNKINSGVSNFRTFQVISQPNVILPNKWNNVVTVYDSGNVSFYCNGSLLTSTISVNDGNSTIVDNNFSLIFGKNNIGAGGQSLNGKIAKYNIYNRALTDSEVLQNYNATKGRFGL